MKSSSIAAPGGTLGDMGNLRGSREVRARRIDAGRRSKGARPAWPIGVQVVGCSGSAQADVSAQTGGTKLGGAQRARAFFTIAMQHREGGSTPIWPSTVSQPITDVIPAQAGTQWDAAAPAELLEIPLGPRLRGDDAVGRSSTERNRQLSGMTEFTAWPVTRPPMALA